MCACVCYVHVVIDSGHLKLSVREESSGLAITSKCVCMYMCVCMCVWRVYVCVAYMFASVCTCVHTCILFLCAAWSTMLPVNSYLSERIIYSLVIANVCFVPTCLLSFCLLNFSNT